MKRNKSLISLLSNKVEMSINLLCGKTKEDKSTDTFESLYVY